MPICPLTRGTLRGWIAWRAQPARRDWGECHDWHEGHDWHERLDALWRHSAFALPALRTLGGASQHAAFQSGEMHAHASLIPSERRCEPRMHPLAPPPEHALCACSSSLVSLIGYN